MATITADTAVAINGGSPVSQRVSVTAESALPAQVTVPEGATAFHITPLAIDVSQLKMLHLLATAAMTIETNDSGSPDDTLTLDANKPLLWYEGCGMDCPLTADVADIYVASVAGGTLTITVGQDITP